MLFHQKLLSEEELRFVKNHKHIPNALLVLYAKDLYKVLKEKRITTYQQVEIDNTHPLLVYAMGKCERIKTPFSQQLIAFYIRFTLCLFIIFLPFDHYCWFAVPLITTIAAAFFLIEKMAIHLDPLRTNLLTHQLRLLPKQLSKI
jgi:putative membrane protein